MKSHKLILITIISIFLYNCENPLYIDAGVIWSDDSYFSEEGDWYLALSEGAYSNAEGETIDVIDQLRISVNKNSINKFVLGLGSKGQITAFVYLDVNQNGQYDDGFDKITGYKSNYADKNQTAHIAVSAFF